MKLTNEEFEYCAQFEDLFRAALDTKAGEFPGLVVLEKFNEIHKRLTGQAVIGTGYGCSQCNYNLVCAIGSAYRDDVAARKAEADKIAAADGKAAQKAADKAIKHVATNGRK